MRDNGRIHSLNERWKTLTGNDLEIPWEPSTHFDLPGLDLDEEKEK
jgi:hypothetical protein